MSEAALLVSVVTPTYRRPALLARCLRALLAQTFDPVEYEIIIVDDAACEETRAAVAALVGEARERGASPDVRYLPLAGTGRAQGPAAARNVGWRAARGAIIAFTDDDCIPDVAWLRAGVAAMVEGVAGAAGRLLVPCPAPPTDYERNASLLAQAEFVTANCFYRRDALARVGGFDERFPVAWREDSDLVFRLMDAGAALSHAPGALVTHPIRPARWGVSLPQQRRSMYNALLYKRHPRRYRKHIQQAPPWRYYLLTVALLTATGGGLARRRGLALVGAGVWLALTAHFCAHRLRATSHAPAQLAEMALTSALIPPTCVYWRLRGALRYRVAFL